MEVLAHICCAPCFAYPHKKLVEEGHTVTGYFFNPNIQPESEYQSRRDALETYSERTGLEVIYPETGSSKEEWIKCGGCYFTRLEEVARTAGDLGMDTFTTSLLSSPWQQHELIKKTGTEMARDFGVDFHYEDYRKGWRETTAISKDMGLYRQKYCGCIRSLGESGYFKGAKEGLRSKLMKEFEESASK